MTTDAPQPETHVDQSIDDDEPAGSETREPEVEWDFLHGLTMQLDRLHPACANSFLIIGVGGFLAVASAVVLFSADTLADATGALLGIGAVAAMVVVPIIVKLLRRRK